MLDIALEYAGHVDEAARATVRGDQVKATAANRKAILALGRLIDAMDTRR